MLLICESILYHQGPVIAASVMLVAIILALGVFSGLIPLPWWRRPDEPTG